MAPNKNKLPKLPGIAWSANDAALTWTLLEKLQKPSALQDSHVKPELCSLCEEIRICIIVLFIVVVVDWDQTQRLAVLALANMGNRSVLLRQSITSHREPSSALGLVISEDDEEAPTASAAHGV
ncbi:hypothetical protein DFH09DRAFT_1339995 [Mycena vulgaris]|nr:hypothetical protein DFH09DRAFT_1339995 [Mycena vulgaris]